jgi:hypothetical protein
MPNRGIVAGEWKKFISGLRTKDGSPADQEELDVLRDFYYAGAAFVLSELFARAYAPQSRRGEGAEYFSDLRDEMTQFMVQNQKRLGIENVVARWQEGGPRG